MPIKLIHMRGFLPFLLLLWVGFVPAQAQPAAPALMPEQSQALGERVLLPIVRAAPAETILITDGFSCREQIRQNSPRHALHLAEVLASKSQG